MVRDEAGFAVVNEGREVSSVVPLSGQICDLFVRQAGIHPAEEELLGTDFLLLVLLGFLSVLLSCRGGSGYLVAEDERPDETKDEFEVVLHDITRSCIEGAKFSEIHMCV